MESKAQLSIHKAATKFTSIDFLIPLEAIAVPTVVLLPDLTMVAVNELRLQVTNTTREETIGRHIFDLFPENPLDPGSQGAKHFRASLGRVLRDKIPDKQAIQRYDIPIRGTNEFEERYWAPINTPILNEFGEIIYILHQAEDVTEFVKIQGKRDALAAEIYRRSEEIRSANIDLKLAKESLEKKVEDRTTQLKKAKEAAESASQMKSAFLANMSHEIRTPLGAIIGFADLLKEENLNSQDREHFLEVISKNSKALIYLIDDILDLAKVEAGRLTIEKSEFSLHDLLYDSVELFREKARQKNIYLNLNIDDAAPDRIYCDPTRLRQIMINLIGNAIKFTSEGGVRVDVKLLSKIGDELKFKIDIKDTGIGLTEDQKARLFKPFAQADSGTSRKFGGTGLGLVLSKKLSEALGGTIKIADCEIGKGCTFSFEFTPNEAKSANAPTRSANEATSEAAPQLILKNIRVLVVDDSPENLFLVRHTLLKNGAIVDTAENGETAISKVTEMYYDIILLDIQMPVMDGYQAKKALDEKGFGSPVVAFTAHAMIEEREKTKSAGFAAHLTKPLDKEELVKVVRTLVTSHRSRRPQPGTVNAI